VFWQFSGQTPDVTVELMLTSLLLPNDDVTIKAGGGRSATSADFRQAHSRKITVSLNSSKVLQPA
jgi:hypothetical protein